MVWTLEFLSRCMPLLTASLNKADHAGSGVSAFCFMRGASLCSVLYVQGFGTGLFFVLTFSLYRRVFGVVYWV
jgi:hypothetical protein